MTTANKSTDNKIVQEVQSEGDRKDPEAPAMDLTKQEQRVGSAERQHRDKDKKAIMIRPEDVEEEVEEEINRHSEEKEKTDEDRKLISDGLRGNLVCSSLKDSEIEALVEAMSFFVFSTQEYVFQQGSMGSHFFIVAEGEFAVVINGEKKHTLVRGKSFGEIALIHNTARTATIVANTNGTLWGVRRSNFRDVLKQLSSRNFVENRHFINSVKLFDALTDTEKNMITNSLMVEKFVDGKDIVREGDPGEVLYIIKEGEAKVTVGGQWRRKLVKGDYFGERALLYNQTRTATVTAVGNTICCSVSKDRIDEVFGGLQKALYRNIMLHALQESKVFALFTHEQLNKLVEAGIASIHEYPAKFLILQEETKARGVRFFIVLEGEVLVSLDKKPVDKLKRGAFFGEDYVLNPGWKFKHKVHAVSNTTLAILTSSAFADCLGTENIDETLNYNNKRAIIKKMYIFRHLSNQQIDMLIRAFRVSTYAQGKAVIKEGDMGSTFYIIKKGEVNVLKEGRKLRTLGVHDYFGERALLYDEPRTATIEAASKEIELWITDKSVFLKIMKGPMLEHLEERIRLQDTKVRFENLEVIRVVGRGTFGTVKLVRHSQTGTNYALKCVSRKSVIQLNQQEHISLEREILAENDHPFIVKLVRTFKDREYLYFLTELITGGELYDAIRDIGILNKRQAQFYLGSIILAVEYLHERKIAFRDLKPENVLLDKQGYIKLIDFGCAKKISGRTYTLVGTPHYMAPEVILGKGYGLSCDVWAFGVCLYEFMMGPLPFGEAAEDQMNIFKEILTAKLNLQGCRLDEDTSGLIKRLLCRLPEVRIGCNVNGYKDLKEHGFFRGWDWDSLLGRSAAAPLVPKKDTYAADSDEAASPLPEELEDVVLEDEYEWDKFF